MFVLNMSPIPVGGKSGEYLTSKCKIEDLENKNNKSEFRIYLNKKKDRSFTNSRVLYKVTIPISLQMYIHKVKIQTGNSTQAMVRHVNVKKLFLMCITGQEQDK